MRADEGAQPHAGPLVPASVLVPIVARENALTVLFTRRTEHLKAHSGQVAFPGGRAEPQDRGPEATALREAKEEIGLEPDRVELLGRLSAYDTRTGFRVTPVVGLVPTPLALAPDPNEVAEVFEVPLAFLLDPRNHRRDSRLWQGEVRRFYTIAWGERVIWGATAAIVVNLSRYLRAAAR
ncbi:MAG: CoA pyrophosphatase [Burkholderiales bacterium]|nr:CoA pyrophosphatase [Burkholderiales bacterium]